MIKDWNNIPPHTKIRVVFYGRVSTENPEQKYALGNQQEWYSQLLEQHKAEWVLARPVETYLDATDIIGLKQNPTNGRRFSPIFFVYRAFSA